MSRISSFLLALVAMLIFNNFAIAVNTLPLNTGFNHAVGSPYPVGVQDNYWINIASYPPSTPFVAPTGAWTIPSISGVWATPFSNTTWISAIPTNVSPATNSVSNPGYTIFRKCFCVQPASLGFPPPIPSLTFSVRGDNNIEIWLNSIVNQVVPAQPGRFSPFLTPIMVNNYNTPSAFRTGRNCLYVLLEDQGGSMGFNLQGTVNFSGLLLIASGIDASFAPCICGSQAEPRSKNREADDQQVESLISDEDEQIIREILEIREARRSGRHNQ